MVHKGYLLKATLLLIVFSFMLASVIAIRTQLKTSTTGSADTDIFLEQFVVSGGPIVWFVLFPMSLITAFLAAEHLLTIRRKKLLPAGVSEEIIETIQQFGLEQLDEQIADRNDFVSKAVSRAFRGARADLFRMRNLLAESLQDQASELFRKIEWLNLIGNVSPMVGLFGTVFGMIKLFNAIVKAGGQPQPAQLANGISVALVTTFWGLFIAIPALAIYGLIRNRIEQLTSDAVLEAEDIMPEIRRCLKKQIEANLKKKEKIKQHIEEIESKKTKPSGQTAQL
ncbi:Tol-Pal system protein TolQ [subsurface metagenome]